MAVTSLAASLALLVAVTAVAANVPVGLKTATSFAILAGSTITNTGPTTITGNVGLHPGSAVTGFTTVTLHGQLHKADAVALQAKKDLVTAYNNAAGRTPVTTVATELGGKTLTAGVYDSNSGTFGLTGTLTLNGQDDPNSVFIFKTASTLITASASRVVLRRGAQACNVFWQVGSSATLATGTRFKGTILALTSITVKTGATLTGRLLARNGAVTLDTNVITRPFCTTPSPTPTPSPTATSTSGHTPAPTAGHTPGTTSGHTPKPTLPPTSAESFGEGIPGQGPLLLIGGLLLVLGGGLFELRRRSLAR